MDGNPLPQVSVKIEFQLTGCSSSCQVSFLLEVWETSTIDRTQARNTSNYRRIERIAPNQDSGLVSQNASIPLDLTTSETGFYLAFVDDNTCIAITRVIVFYSVCPAMVLDLIKYPEILAPPIKEQPQTLSLDGECVDDAAGELGRNPTLRCIQAGKWDAVQEGTGCQCNTGYVEIEDNEMCASESLLLLRSSFQVSSNYLHLQHVLLVSMFRHQISLVSHALPTPELIVWVWQSVSVYKDTIEQLVNQQTSHAHVSVGNNGFDFVSLNL